MGDVRANREAGRPPDGGRGSHGGAAAGFLDRTFLAAPSAAGVVRALLGSQLRRWGLLARADDVYVIAGELLANAVLYAPYREMRVVFTLERDGMRLRVWDSSDDLPIVRPLLPVDVTPDAEALDPGHDDGTGGWGLPIVQALSMSCGVTKTPPRGKWVWSAIAR